MKFRTFRILVAGGVVAVAGTGVYLATRPSHEKVSQAPATKGPPVGGPVGSVAATPPEPPAPAPTPAPTPVATPAPDPARPKLRPIDHELLAIARSVGPGTKIKDALKGRAEKADVIGEPGQTRVKLDLDRDGKWDEKWNVKPDGVKREVAPNDDESYTQTYHLRGADEWELKVK